MCIIQIQKMKQQQNPLASLVRDIYSLVEILKIDKNYKQALKYGQLNYSINQYKINKIKVNEIFDLISAIELNYQNIDKQGNLQNKRYGWLANQLKLYVWMLVCYSFVTNKLIQAYNEQDWMFFKKIFNWKNYHQLQYQSKSLFKNFNGNKQKWGLEEQQIFKRIISNEKYQNKWNQVSKQLYFESNKKYYRSNQKCRQYWYNHIDPKLNKDAWTLQQDLALIKQIRNYGFKWSKITQIFENKFNYRRTEHMIKNRTKILFKKYGFKDEKQEGCKKQLKIIYKKIQQEINSNNLQQQHQLNQQPNDKYKSQRSHQKPKNLMDIIRSSQQTDIKVNQVDIQVKMQQIEIQLNNKLVKQDSKLIIKEPVIPQQDYFSTNMVQQQIVKQKMQSKRNLNIIILYQSKPMETLPIQLPLIQDSQHQFNSWHNRSLIQSQDQQVQIQQQSFYDQYRIVQVEQVEDFNLNQEIRFDHQVHGGEMRDRVTQELAQYFNNFKQNQQ